MIEKQFFVYILASRPNGAIYIGVTSDLVQRISQHREGKADSHTSKYNIKQLVYFEAHAGAEEAIMREKQLKKWTRAKKNDLIMKNNPMWEDLYSTILL